MKLEDGKSEHGSRHVETEGGGRQREREGCYGSVQPYPDDWK